VKTIAIIGGGFCGTAIAVQLARLAQKPLTILLFNHEYPLANGIAYSTDNMIHLLNVPAGRMSLFQDDPTHFVEWILSKDEYKSFHSDDLPSQFMPRKIYGQYVKEVFQKTISGLKPFVQLNIINEEVTDINIENNKSELVIENGSNFIADKIILATGNHKPADLKIPDMEFYQSKKYFGNPWSKMSVENFENGKDIFMIGTSLTMVDTVLSLCDANFKGKIYALSTKGLLPLPYYNYHPYLKILDDIIPGLSLNELFSIYKKHIKSVLEKGWHIDDLTTALRPHSQRIWQELNYADKKKFLVHLSHYWAIARHRLPLHIHSFIQKLIRLNKLEIIAGKLIDLKETADSVSVVYKKRKSETANLLQVQRVINCTGPLSDISKINQPLIKNLYRKKYIAADDFQMGMNATPGGNIIDAEGKISDTVFTIGTNLRGILWESTAVPELRFQAQQLSSYLIMEFEKETTPFPVEKNNISLK